MRVNLLSLLLLLAPTIISLSESRKKNKKAKSDTDKTEVIGKQVTKTKAKNKVFEVENVFDDVINNLKPFLSPKDKEKLNKKINEKNSETIDKTQTIEKTLSTNSEKTEALLEEIKTQRENFKKNTYSSESDLDKESLNINIKSEFSRDELVKAIIMKEILDKPVALREN